MSQIYEALKQSEKDVSTTTALREAVPSKLARPTNAVGEFEDQRLTASPSLQKPFVALTDPNSLAGEKFRILANRLAYLGRAQKLKVIQLTSAIAGEGKSIVAANLAVMLSRRHEERVLLVEGDVHRPSQNSIFGIPAQPGIGEWWESTSESLPKLFRIDDLRLWFLPAGRTNRATAMLQSSRLPRLVNDLRHHFDWIIIDSPPMLPLADTNLWARWADGTLLVVREGMTPKRALEKGLESLDNPKIVGVVLNDAMEGQRTQYYAKYYGARKASESNAK